MTCKHCNRNTCEGCSCEDWNHLWRYENILLSQKNDILPEGTFSGRHGDLQETVDKLNRKEIKPIDSEVNFWVEPKAILTCEACGKEDISVREGKHFQEDLNNLLYSFGRYLSEDADVEELIHDDTEATE